MTNRSFKLALLALTLIPVLLAGIFGYQMLLGLQARGQQQLNELISYRLADIETELAATLDDTATALLASIPDDINTETLYALSRERPELTQALWIDAGGQRRYPEPATLYRNEVADFLKRSEPLWLEGELLRIAGRSAEPLALPPPNRLRRYGDNEAGSSTMAESAAAPIPVQNHGWYTWFWGNTLRHLLWVSVDDGVLGLELNAERLKADVIAALPDAGAASDRRLRLYDSRGEVLYEWGGHHVTGGDQPQLSYALSFPFASWRLDWYSATPAQTARAQNLLLAGVITLLLLVLGGISLFLLREHGREQRLSQQRVNFVNQVSHELKTPLTNLRLYAEMSSDQLDAELAPDHPVRKFLKVINEESLRLTRLVNNVLNYARDQRRQLNIQPRPCAPDAIIGNAVDSFRPAFDRLGIEIRLDLHAAETINIDPDALEQILVNLLGNIEKYAAAGKLAAVRSRIERDTLIIEVRDAGPGIAADQQHDIFDAFYRGSDRINEGVSGTGIGLSIARQLARQHGGDVVSVTADQGAGFEVRLPSQQH